MRHIPTSSLTIPILFAVMLSTVGCSHYQATAAEMAPAPPTDSPHEVLIREARAEADLLRSELASVKIATAKQHAELQSANERIDVLTAREESMAENVKQIKNTLTMAETERDRLRRENAELQARSASLPDLQQLLADVQAIQQSIQQVSTSMKTLMSEVVHIKQDMSRNRRQAQKKTASLTAFSMTTPAPSEPVKGRWRVKAGDTLWSISQHHDTTVNALMELNQLESDLIVEGQTLRVPTMVKSAVSENPDNGPSPNDATSTTTQSH